MDAFICTACGTQYPPSEKPPAECTICEEERQYVPPAGQSWTTPKSLAARSFNCYRQHEPGVIQLWPDGGTYCRSSSQMMHCSGGVSLGAYCVPQAVQMKAGTLRLSHTLRLLTPP